jgi:hypothetical protein
MSRARQAVILLFCLALLMVCAGESTAASKLTPMPPVKLGSKHPRTRQPTSSGSIPHTGNDVRLELLIATALITTGIAIRTRRPIGPR